MINYINFFANYDNKFYLMKINFDTIGSYGLNKTQRTISNPIKIAVQSPIYNQVVREVSPHNYKSQIISMKKMINLPVEVSRFIQMEIEKQINYGETNRIKQVQMVDIQYKQIDKKQQANLKVNKDALKIVTETKKIEKKQKQSKTGWVFNYKKHCCQSSANLPTEVRQTLDQIKEFTGTPNLYDSKISKKMSNGRKLSNYLNATSKHYSVYENLYSDAKQRKIKAQMNKIIQYKKTPKAKPKINSNYYQNSNKSYVPLFQRLNQILENRQAKIKSKRNIDQQSGRQLFKLDLNSSRQSYNIFYQSLSKQKLTYLSKRSINLHETKSIEQQNKINTKQKKSTENKVDKKTIQYFTQIFYPPQNNQIQLSTSTAAKPINKQQFLILHSFLHEIQQLQSKKYQMQTTVSSSKISNSAAIIKNVLPKQQFQQKFKKFYQGLSLHDRQILRKQIVKRKKMEFHKQQEGILTTNTFKPSINVRSASLDNLAKGHSKHIYYV